MAPHRLLRAAKPLARIDGSIHAFTGEPPSPDDHRAAWLLAAVGYYICTLEKGHGGPHRSGTTRWARERDRRPGG